MRRPLVRPTGHAFAVLAAALALVLGMPVQARAAHTNSLDWVTASCATGQFTTIETDVDGSVRLVGEATNCGPIWSFAAFTLVNFYPEEPKAYAYPDALVSYRSAEPTPFSGTVHPVPGPQHVGVCAVRSPYARIACVRVTWPVNGPATMESIPTTDPLVQQPVTYSAGDDEDPGGFCGSCLDDPAS